ncbi:histone methyltransferase [Favolaschia claudopus]|uniref:Histone-lysine N-methyltransferase, H3 lysine-36 specific n=1 Tax=Favolaschia claudopus TaxID=2862362 RepID=A0AAW0DWB9_9AGAR
MTAKVKVEAKASTSRSPSLPATANAHGEDVLMAGDSFSAKIEPDESKPLKRHDSSTPSTSAAASRSQSATPPPLSARTPSGGAKKKSKPPVQLIGDLPVARAEALDTFNELQDNVYQNKSIGRSREALEGMSCECTYRRGTDSPHAACGDGSNCINRLTQIECMPDDCRCGAHCQNQRFQRKEYADIDIVQTEKKGFGLRAEDDIPKDGFIYEYIGDVVNPTSFKKRMRGLCGGGHKALLFHDAAERRGACFRLPLHNFWLTDVRKFIDATKSGGIGRFANHSCNPNCYVAKWTVGERVRMGIFAKRKIQQHEELTFNYNVDRYGHKAQECYCGEPNCVGFIGGKTQTDIATVDDLYLDALGITDEDERAALKGTKKKKGKKLDDEDFLPQLRLIAVKELPKIMTALRQTNSRAVTVKLLTRFKLTNDESTMREMLRLRCMSLMKNVLEDNESDLEIVTLVLESIRPWPLAVRNKVEDSGIDATVNEIVFKPENENENDKVDEKLKTLALDLLDHWLTLPLAYRIPKRVIVEEEEEVEEWRRKKEPVKVNYNYVEPPYKRPRRTNHVPSIMTDWKITPGHSPSGSRWDMDTLNLKPPKPEDDENLQRALASRRDQLAEQAELATIIAAAVAQKAAEDEKAAEAAAAAAAAAAAQAAKPREHKRKHRSHKKVQTAEEKEANKEKRLLKLVGAVVVKCMSKYGKSLERETFKKHAKELTQLIAAKEKKSESYKDNKLESLSDEKVAKIKKFSKEYISKVVRRAEKSGHKGHKHRPPSSTADATPSSAVDTPNSIDGVDTEMMEMTVEEAMGMDPASGSEDEGEDEDGDGEDEGEGEGDDDEMDVDAAAGEDTSMQATDPRRRPPSEENASPSWHPPTESNGISVA